MCHPITTHIKLLKNLWMSYIPIQISGNAYSHCMTVYWQYETGHDKQVFMLNNGKPSIVEMFSVPLVIY